MTETLKVAQTVWREIREGVISQVVLEFSGGDGLWSNELKMNERKQMSFDMKEDRRHKLLPPTSFYITV